VKPFNKHRFELLLLRPSTCSWIWPRACDETSCLIGPSVLLLSLFSNTPHLSFCHNVCSWRNSPQWAKDNGERDCFLCDMWIKILGYCLQFSFKRAISQIRRSDSGLLPRRTFSYPGPIHLTSVVDKMVTDRFLSNLSCCIPILIFKTTL